jgi:hypothetical protein
LAFELKLIYRFSRQELPDWRRLAIFGVGCRPVFSDENWKKILVKFSAKA